MTKVRKRFVRLEPADDDWLVDTAEEHGLPISTIIRFAVRDYRARAREGIRL